MPETVIAWKLVALIISGRKSAERSLSNIIYELKPLIPGVRIDTEVFSGNPDDSYLDTAFKKASTADIVIGVIDEHFSRVAIQSRIVPVDITLSANKLFNYMSLDKAIPKILFIRYSPDNPDESFRSTIDSLIDFYDGNYRRVTSNKDFERNLYSLLWDHLGRFQDRPDLLLPVQGAGPHFGISPSGQIASTSPRDIDQSGNDLRRIDQLLPLLKECADDFLANSGSIGNQHPSLVRDMSRYRQIISVNEEAIDWGLLWGVGVKLESSAAAVERRVADRLAPELEDEPLAALQSLRSLHAPLILATAEGRELQEQADRIRMTKGEQATLRDAAVAFSEGLKQHEEIIEIEAATIVAEAAETVGAEPHPERGTTYGITSLKNVAIILFSAALAVTPKFLLGNYLGDAGTMGAWEALKKWPAFAKAAEALGKDVQVIVAEETAVIQVAAERLMPFRTFIVVNEQYLRVIAGTTPQLKWLLPYVDYIVRTS